MLLVLSGFNAAFPLDPPRPRLLARGALVASTATAGGKRNEKLQKTGERRGRAGCKAPRAAHPWSGCRSRPICSAPPRCDAHRSYPMLTTAIETSTSLPVSGDVAPVRPYGWPAHRHEARALDGAPPARVARLEGARGKTLSLWHATQYLSDSRLHPMHLRQGNGAA